MKALLSILRIFIRFYVFKKEIIFLSKKYLLKTHIIPIVNTVSNIKIYENNSATIIHAVKSDAFTNGLIDHFLRPNKYIINAKDIAVALNMGVYGHSNKSFLNSNVIDIAFYLEKKIKERIMLDENLKYIFKELGKRVDHSNSDYKRKEIEKILNDKKLIFTNYFQLFETNSYTEKITIYYPGYDKSWIDWKEDESLTVSIFEHDIPKGFFLMGFDYKSSKKGSLSKAVRNKDHEMFNPVNSKKKYEENIIWLK